MSEPYQEYPQTPPPQGQPQNQPAYGPPPQPAYNHPPQNRPPFGQPYSLFPSDHPQGTTILVLGVLGFVVGLTAPFAWYLGSKALREIRASGATYANEQNIVIGRVLGMVATILSLIVVAFVVFLVLIIAVTEAAGSS